MDFVRQHDDLVLQGHDHSYARGRNLPYGVSEHHEAAGTMYVVSISGPKMYELTEKRWMDRAAENTQLYQVISVGEDTIRYQAIMVTGELYDAFDLVKRDGMPNQLVEAVPADVPERRFPSEER